jgi:hypothetical protein
LTNRHCAGSGGFTRPTKLGPPPRNCMLRDCSISTST